MNELADAWDAGHEAGSMDATSPPNKRAENPYLSEAENEARRRQYVNRLTQSGYPVSVL